MCVDFLNNVMLMCVIEEMLVVDKLVAADCYGSVALLACKKFNGDLILKGMNVMCFMDVEEIVVGLVEKVFVLFEIEFKKLGV